MLEKAQLLLADPRVVDSGKVVGINGGILALVNLVSLNRVAELVSIGLTIAYTIWRWRRDSKKG